jgi:exodeoxyribonuclease (lambda-induced)
MLIEYTDPQGSDAWLQSRRGVITGSRFALTRERLKTGKPSAAATRYAMDTARERCGGLILPTSQTLAMRIGSEQESAARDAYELETGRLVTECGFFCTEDREFGVSPDGLVGDDGLIEIKTMVSSETLFRCVVDGISADYIDQINGEMWLLNRQWCDLVLWAPDLESIGRALTVRRIQRNEDAIDDLARDLAAFSRIVNDYTAALRGPDEE